MADNNLNKRFFTNTYITGSGRQNYLRIDNLEDPLFTSFTFDIDYTTSPLFYTISNNYFERVNAEGLAANIENALREMYKTYMGKDQGYDILPVLSGSMIDGTKLGFGLQQNVYMDLPLYGATEYIYMVDKRNAGNDQNDVRYNNSSNQQNSNGEYSNKNDSYKLGDSVKSVVNDSDKAWAERQQQQNQNQIAECNDIMSRDEVKKQHQDNYDELYGGGGFKDKLDNANQYPVKEKVIEDGKEVEKEVNYTEAQLLEKVNEYKQLNDDFENFKKEIVDWANSVLSDFQRRGSAIYSKNTCAQKVIAYENISEKWEKCIKDMETEFGPNFMDVHLFKGDESYVIQFYKLYCEVETYANGKDTPADAFNPSVSGDNRYLEFLHDDGKSFLLDKNGASKDGTTIRQSEIIKKFRNKLEYFEMLKPGEESLNFDINVYTMEAPDWAYNSYQSHLSWIDPSNDGNNNIDKFIEWTMSFKCDINSAFDENFTSDKVITNKDSLDKYDGALDQIRYNLYGYTEGGKYDSNNPDPESPYGQYLAAKEKYENDDYSQAEKAKALAESGMSEMNSMLNEYEANNTQNDIVLPEADPGAVQLDIDEKKINYAPQTVFDMIGFISGMKKMTENYPYIIQSITGLDTAYNKHYVVKDPYLGSGDDKITLTCLESLDLRVSSMFNRYFNAVYDRQYRRERVPVNLRRFNCSVYVHDVRNFVSKMRQIDNRILELTDMYYSVIEFKFYDCEIVPEETGNIFNDISNEAPSEMKKTNFTFTYGNCVVNFIPNRRIAAY